MGAIYYWKKTEMALCIAIVAGDFKKHKLSAQ
jgi:hypothetical protein